MRGAGVGGTVSRAASLCRLVCHIGGADGPSTRGGAAGVALLLCRRTALHLAAKNGHTETAMALAKAGADVRCKDDVGYGSSGCILVSMVCHSVCVCVGGGGGVRPLGAELQECRFGCAGIRRCTKRR